MPGQLSGSELIAKIQNSTGQERMNYLQQAQSWLKSHQGDKEFDAVQQFIQQYQGQGTGSGMSETTPNTTN